MMYTLTITSMGSVDGILARIGLGSGDPSSGRGYIFTVPLKSPTDPTSSGSRDPLPRLREKFWARSVNLWGETKHSEWFCPHGPLTTSITSQDFLHNSFILSTLAGLEVLLMVRCLKSRE